MPAGSPMTPSALRALSLALACLALLAGAPERAAAEPAPVGLAAVGVDPRAALRPGLDVRDAFNRPVTREAVERELDVAAEGSDRGAQVSALPRAAELWGFLDRILSGFSLRGGAPSGTPADHSGLPWLPKPVALILVAVSALASLLPRPHPLPSTSVVPATGLGIPLVLRC